MEVIQLLSQLWGVDAEVGGAGMGPGALVGGYWESFEIWQGYGVC